MREIKFRAWVDCSDIREVVTGRHKAFMHYEVDDIDFRYGNLYFGQGFYCPLKYVTLLQYTGLKDKNGKEIYEGDIVRGFEKESGFPPYDSTLPRVIEFQNGCWCFNANRYDEGDWIRFGFWTHSNEGKNQLHQLEVIGNIYENPELLK